MVVTREVIMKWQGEQAQFKEASGGVKGSSDLDRGLEGEYGEVKWTEKESFIKNRDEEDLRSHLGQSILLEKESDSERAQHSFLIFGPWDLLLIINLKKKLAVKTNDHYK